MIYCEVAATVAAPCESGAKNQAPINLLIFRFVWRSLVPETYKFSEMLLPILMAAFVRLHSTRYIGVLMTVPTTEVECTCDYL